MSDVTAARKTVTVLFSDLVESTSLAERLDPEALARVLDAYFSSMRAIVESHGGTVEKFIGDAVVGVFGVPQVHEDDAARAVSAALAMQESIARMPGDLSARIGVNTGEVMVTSVGDNLALGHVMNMGARLQQAAAAGEVLIGAATHQLVSEAFDVEPAGALEVKGSQEPIAAWRVKSASQVAARDWDRDGFVGRERELGQVLAAIEDAGKARSVTSVIVLAPPGMGKSRLAAEVGRRAAASTQFLVGRCVPYGEGITYVPMVEIVRQLVSEHGDHAVRQAMREESDAALVESVIGRTASGASQSSPDETAWAFRRLFEALAANQPLVVVLDDLHWADPLLLDLVEYVTAFAAEVPLTVLGLARPELLDIRPSLLTSQARSTLVRLEPLTDEEITTLLADSGEIDGTTRDRIARAAGGVPLFAEQMAAFQQEGSADVPPTIRSLLAARVDRLEPGDRQILQAAAIEGETFTMSAVARLVGAQTGASIAGRLIALVQRDYVRSERQAAGRDTFRFSHALVRDAVYEQMPRALRADLHARYADLLKASARDRTQLDVIGHHLAAAQVETSALGDLERSRELALAAAEAFRAAGVSAVGRKHWRRGADLLQRAWDLLADVPASRILGAPELITAYDSLGDVASRDRVRDSAMAEAERLGDRSTELRIKLALAVITAGVDAPQWFERALAVSGEALAHFTPLSDDWNLADAWNLRAMGMGHGDSAGMAAAFRQAELHATRSENEGAQIVIWDELGYVILIGESPFTEVADHMRREIEWGEERGIAFTAADGLLGTAYCLHAAAQLEEARALLGRLHDVFASLPCQVSQHAESYQLSGQVERDAGNWGAALVDYERGRQLADGMGNHSWWQSCTNDLAQAYLDLGRVDEAEQLLDEMRDRARTGNPRGEAPGRAARARVASARGDHTTAVNLMAEAMEILARESSPQLRGRLLEYAADIHRAAGDPNRATASLDEALAVYTAKEYEVGRLRVAERLRSPS